MFRLKTGLILSSLAAVAAVMPATPASALFESESGKLSGVVANSEITKGGEFIYETGSAFKCPTKSFTIEWSLPTQKSVKQLYKIKWGSECTILIGGSQLSVTISPTELEVKSPESGKSSYPDIRVTNLVAFEMKSGPCTIIVPAEGNKELKKIEQTSPSLTSFEESVLVTMTSITAEKGKNALCPLVQKTKAAELRELAFKLKGQGQR